MSGRAHLRAAWAGCVVVVAAAYAAAVMPEHAKVMTAERQARELYDAANRDERLLARETLVRRALQRIRTEVESLSTTPASTANMLDAMDRVSRRNHVRILALVPTAAPTPSAGPYDPLQPEEITVDVDGAYPQVLDFVAGLSQQKVLIEVRSLRLAADEGAGAAVTLHAELDSRFYRLKPHWEDDYNDVSTLAR